MQLRLIVAMKAGFAPVFLNQPPQEERLQGIADHLDWLAQARLAELSAVALFKRLRKSKDWLYRLCCALFEERGLRIQPPNQRLRLLDSTQVKEPGKTGSLWRIHYSFQWPSLACDYFKITAAEGNGTGESLQQFPLSPQDYVLADRGYCRANGIHFG